MRFTKATNYALHTMLILVDARPEKPVGVQQLAEALGVSPTYLSKILTRLAKAGMIESASGAGGGYRLSRRHDDLSLLDVIQATEGTASLFECGFVHGDDCVIQAAMKDAEATMERQLKNTRLADLARQQSVRQRWTLPD